MSGPTSDQSRERDEPTDKSGDDSIHVMGENLTELPGVEFEEEYEEEYETEDEGEEFIAIAEPAEEWLTSARVQDPDSGPS